MCVGSPKGLLRKKKSMIDTYPILNEVERLHDVQMVKDGFKRKALVLRSDTYTYYDIVPCDGASNIMIIGRDDKVLMTMDDKLQKVHKSK